MFIYILPFYLFGTRTGKVCVGQAVAIGDIKSAMNKFTQHPTATKLFSVSYRDKGCKNLGGVYPAMSFFGVEEWGILTLDQCSPSEAMHRIFFG